MAHTASIIRESHLILELEGSVLATTAPKAAGEVVPGEEMTRAAAVTDPSGRVVPEELPQEWQGGANNNQICLDVSSREGSGQRFVAADRTDWGIGDRLTSRAEASPSRR